MSEPYAPDTTTAPTSPVTLLDDGDSVTFASLMEGIIVPLWDGVFYLLNHIGGPALTELLAGGPYTWQGDQTWAGAQTWQNDNSHEGVETFLGAASFAEPVSIAKATTYAEGAITDSATFTIDVSKPIWIGRALSQNCVITARSSTAPIPVAGQVTTVRADLSATGFNYAIKREGGAVTVVTLITSAADTPWADLVYTGSFWKLLRYGGGAVAGAGA